METSGGITALKELLFEEENKRYLELNEKIKQAGEEMDDKLSNRELPDKEVDRILNKIVSVMPEKLGPAITKTLKVQIQESRDDVVQALFPIIGQMIKKYIQAEMEVLSQKIDKQFEAAFSFDHIWLRIQAVFTGVSYSELALKSTNEPQILEIFLIEEGSGILMGSYSKNPSFDQDMMSGMLTAIKTFVEDAMEVEKQGLEMISYDLHKIYVQNFDKFYIAVVLSGVIDSIFKSKLDDRIMEFVKEIMLKSENSNTKELTKKISQYFDKI
ncbi:hypothetical protein [Ekhidna sp.]